MNTDLNATNPAVTPAIELVCQCVCAFALIVALVVAIVLMTGCKTPPLTSTSYPAKIQRDCEWAYGQGRVQYVTKFGQPTRSPMWQVRMEQGQRWGGQWAIQNGGQLCGGKTMGVYTVIGCGPNGEINRGDLAHEAFEAWCQVNGKAAH